MLTDVAYDIIKVFRSNNDSFRRAKLESYMQWKLKKGAKFTTLLNFFKSRIESIFFFKSYAYDHHYINQKLWLRIKKANFFLSNYHLGRNYTNEDRGRVYKNSIIAGKKKKILLKLSKHLRSNFDFWYKGLEPCEGSFRIRSFVYSTASWEVSPVLNSYFYDYYFLKKLGKYKGYRHITYSSGVYDNSTLSKLVGIEFRLNNRLFFRNKVLKLLLSILGTCFREVKTKVKKFFKEIDYTTFIFNRNVISMLLNLCNYFNNSRLYVAVKILRHLNLYDIKYLVYMRNGNHYTDMHLDMHKFNKYSFLKSYQKLFSCSLDRRWIVPWFLLSSAYGPSDLIKKLNNAYICSDSFSVYEDYDLIYYTGYHNRCYKHILGIKNRRDIKFFVKWYYLLLLRDKNYLYSPYDFGILEHRRRLLIRGLFFLQHNVYCTSYNYSGLVSFLCSGFFASTLNSFMTKNKFFDLRSYSGVFKMKLGLSKYRVTQSLNFDHVLNYFSFNKNKEYFMNITDYLPYSRGAYTRYFSIFSELRLNIIFIKSNIELSFTRHHDLLYSDDRYYLQYNVMFDTEMSYYTVNIDYRNATIYFNKTFSKYLYLIDNYYMLYLLFYTHIDECDVLSDSIGIGKYYRRFIKVYTYMYSTYSLFLKTNHCKSTVPEHFIYSDIFLRNTYSLVAFSKYEYIMSYILENTLNSKLFGSMVDFGEIEWYNYLDNERDKLDWRIKGSYETRIIFYTLDVISPIPSKYTIYYTMYSMWYYYFVHRWSMRFYGYNFYLNWGIFMYIMSERWEEFTYHLKVFERDISVYKRKRYPDEDLFYGFDVYKHLLPGIKQWKNYRKQSIYIKNRDYLFLIEKQMSNWLGKLDNSCGYYIDKLYGYDDSPLKFFGKYNRYVIKSGLSSLSVIKKFFVRRQKFKGFGDMRTLSYLAELTDINVGYMTRGSMTRDGFFYSDDFCYERLIMGDTLFHNRYLDEKRFYFFRYHVVKSSLEVASDYSNLNRKNVFVGGSSNLFKKILWIIEHNEENHINREFIVEDKLRDSRDFFNPILDYRSLLLDVDTLDNYLQTRACDLYIKYIYTIYNIYDFVLAKQFHKYSYNLYNRVIDSEKLENRFTFHSLFYKSRDKFLFIYDKLREFSKYKPNIYRKEFREFDYNYGLLLCGKSDIVDHAALYTNPFLKERNYIKRNYLFFLYSSFVKSLGFLVRYHLGYKILLENYLHIKYNVKNFGDFYLHSKMYYPDYYFSSFWYIPILKRALYSCKRYYKKLYYLWLYTYLLVKNTSKSYNVLISVYKWWLKYFYKFSFFDVDLLKYYEALFKKIGFFDSLFKFHIGSIFVVNSWLIYWFDLFKYNYIDIDYKLINNYLSVDADVSEVRDEYLCSEDFCIVEERDVEERDPSYRYFDIEDEERLEFILENIYIFYNTFYILFSYTPYISKLDFMFWYCTLKNSFIFNIFLDSRGFVLFYRAFFMVKLLSYINKYIMYWENFKIYYIQYFRLYYNRESQFLLHCIPLIYISNIHHLHFWLIKVNHLDFFPELRKFNIRLDKVQIHSYKKSIRKTLGERLGLSIPLLKILYYNVLPFYHKLGKFLVYRNKYNFIDSRSNYDFYLSGKFNHFGLILYQSIFSLFAGKAVNKCSVYDNVYIHTDFQVSTVMFEKKIYDDYDYEYDAYLDMFEHANPVVDELDNLKEWFGNHYHVKFESRRYYSKFWYRYVPRDIIHIQRYRRFQQEIRRLIANRKRLLTGIIYRRLLLFKLVPGVFKEWHKLHVRRPYIEEQFEDKVRFFYILKYKYNISRRRFMSSIYTRFNSPYTFYKVYHLLYFRLDNILYKLSFVPSFHYMRNNLTLKFWNISINHINDVSHVQKSLIIGDMFYLKNELHVMSLHFRKMFHIENNLYLVYLLFFRLFSWGFDVDLGLPTEELHVNLGKVYVWWWYKLFKSRSHSTGFIDYLEDYQFFAYKMAPYGFWAHNFLKFKEFKVYMSITSLDSYVRWFSRAMCGFVYKEPAAGFFYGLHYASSYSRESGAYGSHLRFNSIFK